LADIPKLFTSGTVLIEDGSTLQMGIGNIPYAVLARLHDKNDLGIHTEMFSDRVVDLVESGVIANRLKKVHPNRITTSFVSGSQRLFDFVNDNAMVEFHLFLFRPLPLKEQLQGLSRSLNPVLAW